MINYDIIIIGGGAAGLMCAWTAGARGRKVLVLEKGKKPGRKILMSGGGKCNFTNIHADSKNFISTNPHFCKSALKRFTPVDFVKLTEECKLDYEERKHGQLFCTGSSVDMLKMLLELCEQNLVTIECNSEVTDIQLLNNGRDESVRFEILTGDHHYYAQSIVIACGGLSVPPSGACDSGYRFGRKFGLDIVPTRAGLVPFTFTGELLKIFSDLSGIAIPAALSCNNVTFKENILFTHRGLSGPAALQLSNYWEPGTAVVINLFPEISIKEQMIQWKSEHPKSLLRNLLDTQIPRRLVQELEKLFWPEHTEKPIGQYSDKLLGDIALKLHHWQVKPAGTEGYRTAEVTLGGISTAEISSKTMECHKIPGLYIIGEVVDVTGHLGGFNFQWAWSSGFVAGQYA